MATYHDHGCQEQPLDTQQCGTFRAKKKRKKNTMMKAQIIQTQHWYSIPYIESDHKKHLLPASVNENTFENLVCTKLLVQWKTSKIWWIGYYCVPTVNNHHWKKKKNNRTLLNPRAQSVTKLYQRNTHTIIGPSTPTKQNVVILSQMLFLVSYPNSNFKFYSHGIKILNSNIKNAGYHILALWFVFQGSYRLMPPSHWLQRDNEMLTTRHTLHCISLIYAMFGLENDSKTHSEKGPRQATVATSMKQQK